MVDSIGASMSYDELFKVNKNAATSPDKVQNTQTSDDRETIKQNILEAASDTRLSQTLRSRFDRYESQIAGYEQQFNRNSTEENSYTDISESLSNISDMQKEYNREDISEEDRLALQEKVNEEISGIKKIYDETQFDDKNLLRMDSNVEKLIENGFSLEEPDNNTLDFAKSELDMRVEDSANRREMSQQSLDRVNEQYDESLKGAQVATGTFNPQNAVDNVRFELLNNIGVKNISDYYTLSASSVFDLLN